MIRIMAIDYGDAHTGVAFSDPTGLLAGRSTTIHSWREEVVLSKAAELAAENQVDRIVLGFPKNMDGTDSLRADIYQNFARRLEELTGLPIILWDERRTTIDAHNILLSMGQDGRKRKKTVDAMAAVLILEGYLTLLRNRGELTATGPEG